MRLGDIQCIHNVIAALRVVIKVILKDALSPTGPVCASYVHHRRWAALFLPQLGDGPHGLPDLFVQA